MNSSGDCLISRRKRHLARKRKEEIQSENETQTSQSETVKLWKTYPVSPQPWMVPDCVVKDKGMADEQVERQCFNTEIAFNSSLNNSDIWLGEMNLSALQTDTEVQDEEPVLPEQPPCNMFTQERVTALEIQRTHSECSKVVCDDERHTVADGENRHSIFVSRSSLDSGSVNRRQPARKSLHPVHSERCCLTPKARESKANPGDNLNCSGEADLFDGSFTEEHQETEQLSAGPSARTDMAHETVSNNENLQSDGSLDDRLPQSLKEWDAKQRQEQHSEQTEVSPFFKQDGVKLEVPQQNDLTPKLSNSFLKHRLKSRLLQNASNVTTSTAANNFEEQRQESIARARLEASQIRREGLEDGIGPFYGLPSKVQQLLSTNRKITQLYDWQDQCLKLPAVYEGRNLIYTLPTSGGKTLVAEILILRQLLCRKKDSLLILPYIAIVQEKVRILSEFATELGFLVEEYAGSKGRFPPTKRRQKHSLFVATIEKGQSLINSLIEAGRLGELGLVVVDELHMIGEGGSRGAAMESTLLKVLNATKEPPQIIGMSATLNNIADLAKFMDAEIFSSNFRPVDLTEYVKVEDNLYKVNNKASVPEDKLQHEKILTFTREDSQQVDPDQLLDLVLEIVPAHSCLLFCPTKRHCENVALMLAKRMAKHHRHLTSCQKEKRRALLQELHTDGGGKLCPTLKYTVHFGLAYHHSGLTTDERRLIEDAYSDGVLCLLTCTSTLAAGVNLPAKRVILRSPYMGADFIKHSQYKQMTGRAGRAGIDSYGESILIAKKADLPKVVELLSGPQDVCHSSMMYQSGKGLRMLTLSLIGLKMVETTQAVYTVMQRTLLAVQAARLGVDMVTATHQALQDLLDAGLVVQKLVNGAPTSSCPADVGDCTDDLSEEKPPLAKERDSQEISQIVEDSKDNKISPDMFEETFSQKSKRLRTERKPSPHRPDKATLCVEEVEGQRQVNTEDKDVGGHTSHSPSDYTMDVSELGRAVFKGSVDIEYAIRLYEDLKRGEQSLVVTNHLHLLYLVTPYDLSQHITPSWMIYMHQLGTLGSDELKVASLIGVTEGYIVRRASGQSTRQKVDMVVVQRFYLTLMLYELWQQYTVWDVSERFQQPRGFIQNLLSSAASFASCVLRFCQELPEFWAYQDLLGHFGQRLTYCVTMELLPLMEVAGVKVGRARQLYNAGYHTLQSLAAAEPAQLVSEIQFLTHKAARQIVASAKVILEEKTEALMEQVEQLVPLPLPPTSPPHQ